MNKKWYQKSLGIILLLIFFFPVGLYLMWKHATWRKQIKIGITVVFVILGLISFATNGSIPSETTQPNTQTTETVKENTATEPTESPKTVEKINVEVTSQIVKKVDKKYRYFFDIRNNDAKPFEGEVTITLYNDKQQSPLGKDTFNTNKPIEPSLGSSVYLDINTSPYGEYGITKFKYVVKINGNEVNAGEGAISDNFENLD